MCKSLQWNDAMGHEDNESGNKLSVTLIIFTINRNIYIDGHDGTSMFKVQGEKCITTSLSIKTQQSAAVCLVSNSIYLPVFSA